jgi:uncharacterized membrane protein YdjX (TVP38/TMEM64 family)
MIKINRQQIFSLVFLIIFIFALLYLYHFTPFYSLFSVEKITLYIEANHEYAILIFWFINFIGALLFIPLTLFWIVAGILFGSITGTILTATASTAAATMAFLLTKKQEGLLELLINKNTQAQNWKNKLENKVLQNCFSWLFIIRVLPHPFILFSYLCGLTKSVTPKPFITATFLAITPISFSFVLLGDSLLHDIKIIILPIILILFVTQLPKLLKKYVNISDE